LRLDSTALRAGADGVSVGFLTPAWARAAKLRVLARPSADGTALDASDVLLLPLESAPDVILRPDE
jgi:hypothetical protein